MGVWKNWTIFFKAAEFIKENKYTKTKTVALWAMRVSYSECSLCIKYRWWWGVYILSSSSRKNQLDQLTWNVTWCLLRLPHRNYIMNAKVPTVLARIFCPNGNFFTNHEDFSDFTSIIALWEKNHLSSFNPLNDFLFGWILFISLKLQRVDLNQKVTFLLRREEKC